MKNWLTIGQFARRAGFTAKALRLYEKMGLIVSHARGENDYRYYDEAQLAVAAQIKEFKDLGFSLGEIKDLLLVDPHMSADMLRMALGKRQSLIAEQADLLRNQKNQIDKILSSLHQNHRPLQVEDRRAIMTLYGNVSIVVTGTCGLPMTAQSIQEIIKRNGKVAEIFTWNAGMPLPDSKPYILIVPESALAEPGIDQIHPDVVVTKNLSHYSENIIQNYLRLFTEAGAHMNTVLNADDAASLKLGQEQIVKKTRYFYFSKNGSLEGQISKIGGVISDSDEVKAYGFNFKKEIQEFRLGKVLSHEEETSYIAAVASVMSMDFDAATIRP